MSIYIYIIPTYYHHYISMCGNSTTNVTLKQAGGHRLEVTAGDGGITKTHRKTLWENTEVYPLVVTFTVCELE